MVDTYIFNGYGARELSIIVGTYILMAIGPDSSQCCILTFLMVMGPDSSQWWVLTFLMVKGPVEASAMQAVSTLSGG